jgi:D-alanine-D-alanine ligase
MQAYPNDDVSSASAALAMTTEVPARTERAVAFEGPALAEARAAAAAVGERVRKVALLLGGTSGEREVSLASGGNVAELLEAEGFELARIDPAEPDWWGRLQAFAPDAVFIALHGRGGEDGSMQGLLELLHLPYTHSGVLASALAMDKERSKAHYRAEGLAVPASVLLRRGPTPGEAPGEAAGEAALMQSIGLPCVVKPVCDGSSLGVSIVRTASELEAALEKAFALGTVVMVEKFVAGLEVTVPVLGNERAWALPVIEIIPVNEFYDYESKYAVGGSEHIIPARINPELTAICQSAAVRAHEALGCRGVSRTDLIIGDDGLPFVIETNTIPGMTGTSLVPESARVAGLEPGVLCRYLLALALEASQGAREASV